MTTTKPVTLYVVSSEDGESAIETPWELESDLLPSTKFDVFCPNKCVYEWCYAKVGNSLADSVIFTPPNFTGWSVYEINSCEYSSDEDNDSRTVFSESYFSISTSTCGCDWKIILDQDNTDIGSSMIVSSSVTIVAPDGTRETIVEIETPEEHEKLEETLTSMLVDNKYHSNCFYSEGHLSWDAEQGKDFVESPYEEVDIPIKLLEISDVASYNRCFPVVDKNNTEEILWASIDIYAKTDNEDAVGSKYKMLNVNPNAVAEDMVLA